MYVWFDALTNYISALDYGDAGALYERWWQGADQRIHVVGKGITRFHAVYWPAFLLSAGEPIPTRIQVHPYLSLDGAKLSKSSGAGLPPTQLADDYGSDALRWWITSDVNATNDTDFTIERLVGRANDTLANGLGNAINRVTTLRHRNHDPAVRPRRTEPLDRIGDLETDVATALADFDRRRASEHIIQAITAVNQHIETSAPWNLARRPHAAQELTDLLERYLTTLGHIARALEPITPDLSQQALEQLHADPSIAPQPLYTRLDNSAAGRTGTHAENDALGRRRS